MYTDVQEQQLTMITFYNNAYTVYDYTVYRYTGIPNFLLFTVEKAEFWHTLYTVQQYIHTVIVISILSYCHTGCVAMLQVTVHTTYGHNTDYRQP
jgi:hypothetical protein